MGNKFPICKRVHYVFYVIFPNKVPNLVKGQGACYVLRHFPQAMSLLRKKGRVPVTFYVTFLKQCPYSGTGENTSFSSLSWSKVPNLEIRRVQVLCHFPGKVPSQKGQSSLRVVFYIPFPGSVTFTSLSSSKVPTGTGEITSFTSLSPSKVPTGTGESTSFTSLSPSKVPNQEQGEYKYYVTEYVSCFTSFSPDQAHFPIKQKTSYMFQCVSVW